MAAVAAKAAATERAGVTAGNFLVTIIKIGGNGRVPPIFLHSLQLAGRFSASVDSARPLIRLLAHVGNLRFVMPTSFLAQSLRHEPWPQKQNGFL
jgi:hypothetical protein